jgi:hypothetical protein
MIFQKAKTKTLFKPSFSHKKNETDFYHVIINDEVVGEIEVKSIGKFGKPEILSAYTTIRGKGIGKKLVDVVLDIYHKTDIYVMTTKESKPFWIKLGASEFDDFLCVFKQK